MDRSVPIRSSLWFGTGTVMVEFSVRRCIMTWLPLCLTLEKPFYCKTRQTSSPESRGNLGNAHLQRRYVRFRGESVLDLFGGGAFEKEFDGLPKIRLRFLDGISLACNINH